MVVKEGKRPSKMKAYVLSTLVFIVGWHLLLTFYIGGGELNVEALLWAVVMWVLPFLNMRPCTGVG